jgi:APA family basic amino acid/polyamine antiporter
MTAAASRLGQRLLALKKLLLRKPLAQIQQEAGSHGLRRVLGAFDLMQLGIGCVIGAGIFVMVGNAAAQYAGPAVILSFLLAFVACGFAGLCYAELASALPVAGSAYTYAYATMGEAVAWSMGWLLLLEYGISAAAVAVGWSETLVNLLSSAGIELPAGLSQAPIHAAQTPDAAIHFVFAWGANLVGAVGVLGASAVLLFGVSGSARANNIIVAVKLGVLLLFIGIGIFHVDPRNWHPFLPHNQGGFTFGWPGVFRGASTVFFAYIGFEAVSTAASEARRPKVDVPVGILGTLIVCTIIYVLVALVLTGIVPYRELNVAAPIALAVDRIGMPWVGLIVKLGALAGLTSVMLTLIYGQSRIFFSMARDGLLPAFFARIHPRFGTPWSGTLVLGVIIAIITAIFPLDILGDLVSFGTALAFALVCLSVLILRITQPDLVRPFRAPGGLTVPILGAAASVIVVIPMLLDMIVKAATGEPLPLLVAVAYLAVGAGIYAAYGYRRSRLRESLEVRSYSRAGQ